ncbi:hypothetical protein AVEN_126900-1 [Araneus ventricosus]|uniref:Uncharacterized protein n=1 Tax=Araneus ventricosus TaxID=182803 RepID=A0A4Y2C0J1_ARAVE|nr:hypothetical protein AVEN_126900-1 [Araneus ventricosus]
MNANLLKWKPRGLNPIEEGSLAVRGKLLANYSTFSFPLLSSLDPIPPPFSNSMLRFAVIEECFRGRKSEGNSLSDSRMRKEYADSATLLVGKLCKMGLNGRLHNTSADIPRDTPALNSCLSFLKGLLN